MEREVKISTGGKDVPLNDFVRELVVNVVLGLMASLKKCDPSEEIVIRIGPKK